MMKAAREKALADKALADERCYEAANKQALAVESVLQGSDRRLQGRLIDQPVTAWLQGRLQGRLIDQPVTAWLLRTTSLPELCASFCEKIRYLLPWGAQPRAGRRRPSSVHVILRDDERHGTRSCVSFQYC